MTKKLSSSFLPGTKLKLVNSFKGKYLMEISWDFGYCYLLFGRHYAWCLGCIWEQNMQDLCFQSTIILVLQTDQKE